MMQNRIATPARLPRARAVPPPAPRAAERRRVVDVAGYRIFTREWGTGDEAVVLLHGLSGSSRWWMRNVQAFATEFRVVVPDLIGFGRTRCPGPVPTLPELADTIAEWLRGLQLRRIHLVGHSMGGLIAAHLAARHADLLARLVLVDAAGIPVQIAPAELLRLATESATPATWGDPRFLPVIAGDALRAGPRSILLALRNVLRDDVRPLLEKIRVPTLVLWGDRDLLFPVRLAAQFRDAIRGAELVVIPGAAHNPMVDRPQEFNRVVLGFLRGRVVGR